MLATIQLSQAQPCHGIHITIKQSMTSQPVIMLLCWCFQVTLGRQPFNIIPPIVSVATKLVSPPPADVILSVDEDCPFRNEEFDDVSLNLSFVTFNGVIYATYNFIITELIDCEQFINKTIHSTE